MDQEEDEDRDAERDRTRWRRRRAAYAPRLTPPLKTMHVERASQPGVLQVVIPEG